MFKKAILVVNLSSNGTLMILFEQDEESSINRNINVNSGFMFISGSIASLVYKNNNIQVKNLRLFRHHSFLGVYFGFCDLFIEACRVVCLIKSN